MAEEETKRVDERMLKRFSCNHKWVETYYYIGDRQYTCTVCGYEKYLKVGKVNSWKVKRTIKGDTFIKLSDFLRG